MNKLGPKALAVAAITIGLLVPLWAVGGLVLARTAHRNDARASIARAWTDAQTVAGPVLVIPERTPSVREDGKAQYLIVQPAALEIGAALHTESRRRGLYSVPVYQADLELAGAFAVAAALEAAGTSREQLDLGAAFVALSLSDARGIAGVPALTWGEEPLDLASGTGSPDGFAGIHAAVPLDPLGPAEVPFRLELDLRGLLSLEFAPVAADTRVEIEAEWPHPSFSGRFLPLHHEIGDDGFRASWSVPGLASGRGGASFYAERLAIPSNNAFGVELLEPVDVYLQVMRSVKYGHLIVLLTFTAFFLFETVRRLRLHPVQYLLVGLALVIFFLLLLALSEHLAFWLAYLIAAGACVGLISAYAAAILGTAFQRASLTATLGGLYAMLYAILRSEDNALLMGTLVLFFALAAVMLVTRRVDWYGPRPGPAMGDEVPGTTP